MDAIQAYRQSEITADNPVHLVVLLYDQLARDLQRAIDAIAKQDVARRCRELDHALVVVGQLQGTINIDHGGEVAQTLDQFYSVVRRNLLSAASQESATLLEQQRRQILAVREAWLEVERRQPPAATPAPTQRSASQRIGPEASEWKI